MVSNAGRVDGREDVETLNNECWMALCGRCSAVALRARCGAGRANLSKLPGVTNKTSSWCLESSELPKCHTIRGCSTLSATERASMTSQLS